MGKDGTEKKRKPDRDEDPFEREQREKKKAAKKAEKVAKMLGYTNDQNPFGDSNLLQPFMWKKKTEKDRSEGLSTSSREADKRLDLMDEINRVRKRREEREQELEEMERLRSEEQRLREAAMYGDWQQKEEEFHTEQTKVRTKIRLSEKREQPIDFLAKNIILIETAEKELSSGKSKDSIDLSLVDLEVEIRDPASIIESLHVSQLDKLIEDIGSYLQLAKKSDSQLQTFWESLRTIAGSRKRKATRRSGGAIHKSLREDVERLLADKTEAELDLLERDIRRNITEREGGDPTYWEEIGQEVALERARASVATTHRDLLRRQLGLLSEMKREAKDVYRRSMEDAEGDEGDGGGKYGGGAGLSMYGPRAGAGADLDPASAEAALYRAEQEKGMEEAEERMQGQDEITLPGETYWWQDKYRPRKPRYFNRVRTGWDWNKYNQTHYDHDNPPPKTIQGYKFAVFYPDLIDKTVTPKYFVEAADEKEFAILRFHAGPPYEDVAFKIINREWEINRRAGFRCVFERGVLQLHFNFKRHWYRR